MTIERLAAGGDGVARLDDGRALFVPLSAPGDRLRVRLTEARRRFARAEIVEILEAGSQRRAPECAVFGRCGGCSWQHLDYAAQVAAKRSIISDALQRIGGFEVPGTFSFHASPEAYGYRQRARLLSQGDRVGYRARRSHDLCATGSCPVLVPALSAELSKLAEDGLPGRHGFPASGGDEWELAAGIDEVRTVPLPIDSAEPAGPIEMQVGADRLRISPGVFAQANGLLLATLVESVCAAALPTSLPPRSLVELYAGAGSLTLALARRAQRMLAVESNPASASDLRHNIANAGLSNVEVRCEATEVALEGPLSFEPDVIVLDPPRSGLEAEATQRLAELGASRIAYLSCDPGTQARDLAVLGEAGYILAQVEGFDLFPQTAHVESLCVMVREG